MRLDHNVFETWRRRIRLNAGQCVIEPPAHGPAQGHDVPRDDVPRALRAVPILPDGRGPLIEHVKPAGPVFTGDHPVSHVGMAGIRKHAQQRQGPDKTGAEMPIPLLNVLQQSLQHQGALVARRHAQV